MTKQLETTVWPSPHIQLTVTGDYVIYRPNWDSHERERERAVPNYGGTDKPRELQAKRAVRPPYLRDAYTCLTQPPCAVTRLRKQ